MAEKKRITGPPSKDLVELAKRIKKSDGKESDKEINEWAHRLSKDFVDAGEDNP